MWHRSHTTCAWPPLSGKPVLLWSSSMSERFVRFWASTPFGNATPSHRAAATNIEAITLRSSNGLCGLSGLIDIRHSNTFAFSRC
jgi:hypothetical protein